MSKFFISHPIPAIVLAIILTLVGALAALRLPVAEYPDIAPPTVFVDTSYIGAGNIEYMSSNVDASGNYELTVVFKQGTDIDNAAVSVQNKVSDIMSDLPAEVQSQGVTVSKNAPDSVFMFSLISPNGSYDSVFMKNYAVIYLIDSLKRVDGVGKVTSYDGDYSMRIWLNPAKLAELGLAISDVETAIKEQNVQAAVGSLGRMPVKAAQENEFVGRSTNRKQTPADFENIIVKAADGSFVRVKDFARVEVGARNMDSLSFQNGREAATFAIQLTNDANTLETVAEVKRLSSRYGVFDSAGRNALYNSIALGIIEMPLLSGLREDFCPINLFVTSPMTWRGAGSKGMTFLLSSGMVKKLSLCVRLTICRRSCEIILTSVGIGIRRSVLLKIFSICSRRSNIRTLLCCLKLIVPVLSIWSFPKRGRLVLLMLLGRIPFGLTRLTLPKNFTSIVCALTELSSGRIKIILFLY